ncbi:MAG: PAS domain S-box protein [Methanosarcina sp.]
MEEKLRKSGLDFIGDISWGTHFCQFYQTKQDLLDILVPYFKAGLENNEFCLWMTLDPKETEEAKAALRKAIPELDIYLEKGQIEIIPYIKEYINEVILNPEKLGTLFSEKLNSVFAGGFAGIRGAGDTAWLEKKDWNNFVNYERELDSIIDNYKIITLCTYFLDKHTPVELVDVALNHQFTVVKRGEKWEKIESPKRKQAEKAAVKATRDWEYTFDAVPDPIAILDKKYRVIRANRAMAARLGVTPEECVGATCYQAIHGTDRPPAYCPHRQLLKDGLEHIKEVREENLGGDFIVSVSPLFGSEGEVAGCIHVARDINERKKTEEILVRSENKFRTLVENSPDMIARFDRENRHTHINPAGSRVYERSQEEIIGKTHRELGMDCENIEFWERNHEKVFATGTPLMMEFQFVSPKGKEYYFDTRIVPEFANGKVISALAISRDITDLKKVEARLKDTLDNLEDLVEERTSELEKACSSLKESEAELAEAQRIATLGSWSWDIEADKLSWSDETYRIFGLEPQEFGATYMEFLNRVLPDDLNYVNKCVRYALKGEPYSIDCRILRVDGEERIIHAHAEVIFNEENKPVKMLGTVQDITERKKIEQALEESEERYRSFIQNFKGIAFKLDKDLVLEFMKGDVEEITGYTEEEIISGNLWRKLIEPDDFPLFLRKAKEMKACPSVHEGEIEYRIKSKDGKIKWLYEIYQKVPGRDESLDKYQGVIYDVTEKKYSEEMLLNIEAARKKEIHHRIKNNLQVISSLLDLQAEKFKNRKYIEASEFLEAFRESQDRVISIALIHEELHEGRGTDKLNFSPYLEKLIENLFVTYKLGNFDLKLEIDIEANIFFDMDVAVPLGLIVNEIVSNSLKYAFKDRNEGKIEIKLNRQEKKEDRPEKIENKTENVKQNYRNTNFRLIVSDDGIGISDDFDLETSETLGIELITALVDQLEGKLDLKKDPGTQYILDFAASEI